MTECPQVEFVELAAQAAGLIWGLMILLLVRELRQLRAAFDHRTTPTDVKSADGTMRGLLARLTKSIEGLEKQYQTRNGDRTSPD